MNKIKIPIDQQLCDYINRVIFERNNLCFIISRFFEKHAKDTDDSILYDDSFLKYHKELELISYEYNAIVDIITSLVNKYLENINIENPKSYDWSINDFVNDKCITVVKAGTRS